MYKQLLTVFLCTFFTASILGQVVVLDFETPETSTTFQYFGSSLEPMLTNVIANPDPSGINTSAMVSDFAKPTDGQTWAGAFSNPNPSTAIDLVSNTEICIKVWFDQPGNLALKLENGTLDNWIFIKEVTEAQTWVELCYDPNEPSIETPFLPAAGGVFNRVVLFFDFGFTVDTDRTYYFDDMTMTEGNAEPVDVTFSVDMNEYSGSFTTPFVSGTFNDWSADANPMTDADADGVWTATVMDIAPGTHEYKFQLDGWTTQEEFNGTETCTVTDPSGQFVNRQLVATVDDTLATVCYNSCYACGESVKITINLGEGNIDVSDDGLFIAGGGNFGNPGDFLLDDSDGDGVHSITVERAVGFSSHYTFTNGACPAWDCKENIAGQDCADPNNFNDRFMGPVMQDTVINTCFGICTDDLDCSVASGDVTFSVDMNNYTETFTTVYIAGTFNNWSGDANALTDDDADGIWTTTLNLNNGPYQYKFELDNWSVSEEFTDGDPCTVTDGGFVNRALEVDGDAEVCFVWNSCDECEASSNENLVQNDNLFSLAPSIIQGGTTRLIFNEGIYTEKEVQILSSYGKVLDVLTIEAGVNSHTLDMGGRYSDGIYFINVKAGNKYKSSRVFVIR